MDDQDPTAEVASPTGASRKSKSKSRRRVRTTTIPPPTTPPPTNNLDGRPGLNKVPSFEQDSASDNPDGPLNDQDDDEDVIDPALMTMGGPPTDNEDEKAFSPPESPASPDSQGLNLTVDVLDNDAPKKGGAGGVEMQSVPDASPNVQPSHSYGNSSDKNERFNLGPAGSSGGGNTKSTTSAHVPNASSGQFLDLNTVKGRERRNTGSVSSRFMVNQDINSVYKVYRQYLISLVIVVYVIIEGALTYFDNTYEFNNTVAKNDYECETTFDSSTNTTSIVQTDDCGTTAEKRDDHYMFYQDMFLATFSIMFFAVSMTMYFYSRNKRPSPDGSGVIVKRGNGSVLSGTLLCQIVIIILYVLGALCFIMGFLALLEYYFDDEDYSPLYPDQYGFTDFFDENYLFGMKIRFWAIYANLPMYVGILFIQYLLPKLALDVFEMRMFLYSSVLCVAGMFWAIYFASAEYYDADNIVIAIYGINESITEINETYRETDEVTFHATAAFLIILCIFSGLMAAFSMYKIVKNGHKSDAYRTDVFQLWCILAIVLFLIMMGTTVAFGCASVTGYESFPHLWISVVMICTDILL